ncbi:hypothetical protein ACSQ67_021670 [Phaseolus vulgaris]
MRNRGFCTLINQATHRKLLPIPHRTLPEPRGQDLDFITVAHSHVINSHWEKLHPLCPVLTPFRLKHLLLNLQNDHVLSLKLSQWLLHHHPSTHTLETLSFLLHTLAKHRQFKTIQTILTKILSSNPPHALFHSLLHSYPLCNASPLVFDAVFKTLAHTSKFRSATLVYTLMKQHGFSLTVESCNAFLSSLLRLRRADIALSFYREMRRSYVSPNVYTLNMVVRAHCMLGEVQKGFEIFQKMGDMGLSPTVVSFNTLISGYCNKGLFGLALKVKALMGDSGVQANVVTFNTLISGFCKERKLHEANRVFSEMKVANVAPNVVTYNTLLHGYGQVGDSEMGGRVYEEMVRNGVKADILTYNALILGLCKEGKTKKAAGFVKELDKENMIPNASTFSALITGQCVRNNSERAFLIYRSMVRSGCNPNEHTFQMLISAFCKNEDFDGAVQVLRDMLGRLMSPDSSMLSELCHGLGRCGKSQLALSLCSEMEARRLLPDGYRFRQGCSSNGDSNISLLQIMGEKSLLLDPTLVGEAVTMPKEGPTILAMQEVALIHAQDQSGLQEGQIVRYPDDIYDRIWSPYNPHGWKQISTTLAVANEEHSNNGVPSTVFQTAATPENASDNLRFSYQLINGTIALYVYMYFAEIEKLAADQTREFNVYVNGALFVTNASYSFLGHDTVMYVSSETELQIWINRTNKATMSPILNGIELYEGKTLDLPETYQNDVGAIMQIKSTYNIKQIWQGDPCSPKTEMWKGVNCSYNGHNQPRIISLNLSSSGLNGSIVEAISNLKLIQYL